MAKIEGFRVKNFKSLKDVTLGRLWKPPENQPITPRTAVIGKNGTGKSALFDAFGFLADTLKFGVKEACDARGRGGFDKIRTQGQTGPIKFAVYYREHGNARPMTYEVAIGPYVVLEEIMLESRGNEIPSFFLLLKKGRSYAWIGSEAVGQVDEVSAGFNPWDEARSEMQVQIGDLACIESEDRCKLGIATLGALKQHPRIVAFRRFIEGWYLSYFTPDAARSLPLAGPQQRLNVHGDNLGNVVQFMEREHPRRFQGILKRIADKIPGIGPNRHGKNQRWSAVAQIQ